MYEYFHRAFCCLFVYLFIYISIFFSYTAVMLLADRLPTCLFFLSIVEFYRVFRCLKKRIINSRMVKTLNRQFSEEYQGKNSTSFRFSVSLSLPSQRQEECVIFLPLRPRDPPGRDGGSAAHTGTTPSKFFFILLSKLFVANSLYEWWREIHVVDTIPSSSPQYI